MNRYKKIIEDLLASAGIEINRSHPWDIHIKNDNFYRRVLKQGSIGLGESYMEDWWECAKLDEFLDRLFSADPEKKIKENIKLKWLILKARLFNFQTKKKAEKSIASHYNIGNRLYEEMLDLDDVFVWLLAGCTKPGTGSGK